MIREMSHLVKAGQLVDKIADVLSQMLQQTDESQEITLLTNALAECLKCHPKGDEFFLFTFTRIFTVVLRKYISVQFAFMAFHLYFNKIFFLYFLIF